jgi:hypothetical protein
LKAQGKINVLGMNKTSFKYFTKFHTRASELLYAQNHSSPKNSASSGGYFTRKASLTDRIIASYREKAAREDIIDS